MCRKRWWKYWHMGRYSYDMSKSMCLPACTIHGFIGGTLDSRFAPWRCWTSQKRGWFTIFECDFQWGTIFSPRQKKGTHPKIMFFFRFFKFQALFENDNSHLKNAYVKFVMCMLQGDYNIKDLVVTLPQDIQALVLLHNPNGNHNLTSTFYK